MRRGASVASVLGCPLACALACASAVSQGVTPGAQLTATFAPPPTPPAAAAPPPAANADPQAELRARYAERSPLQTLRGKASYYADSLAGNATASGEPYDPRAFTAAHRTLPFGSVVRVRTIDGARSVYLRVNDRGPFGDRRRVVDVSHAAAIELDMLRAGVIEVVVELLERP